MLSTRPQDLYNYLANEIRQTYVYPHLIWEPHIRLPEELVSEFLEEKVGREIVASIDKFKDAFDIVLSRSGLSKYRVIVNLRLFHQLKQLEAIVDYLNQYHAPEGRTTWEVKKVITGDKASYPICFTNFPMFDARFDAIHDQLYKWIDQPSIAAKFKLIKPEHQRHCTIYTVTDGELLKELSVLANQSKSLHPTPKP